MDTSSIEAEQPTVPHECFIGTVVALLLRDYGGMTTIPIGFLESIGGTHALEVTRQGDIIHFVARRIDEPGQ